MPTRITTLVENSLGENLALRNEHGLSFFIETGKDLSERIIFDTGQSDKFIYNANLLNIDLTKTNKVIISHGHYDHSGGFKELVKTIGTSFELYINSEFLTPKYANNNGAWEFLGNNFDRKYLEEQKIKTFYITEDTNEIGPNVYVVGNFKRNNEFEKLNPRFYTARERLNGTDYLPDPFNDEIAIVIEAKEGLLLLLGCSHPGLVNIIDSVRSRFSKPIHCIIGGTHLVEADDIRLERTLRYLRDLNLPLLGISHCTGEKAIEELRKGEKQFFLNTTGTSLIID